MRAPGLAEEPEGEGYFASVSDLMVGVLFVFLLMLTVFALNFREDSAQLDQLRRELAIKELELENKARELEESERALVVQREAARIAREEAELAREEAERESTIARAREAEATRLRAQNEALQARLQEAAEKLRRELADREAARTALLVRLRESLAARRIQAFVDQRSGVLRLSDAVPFDTGRSVLTETARRSVTGLGEVLAEVLPCFSNSARPQNCEIGDSSILEAVLVEGHTDRQLFRNSTAVESAEQNDRLSTERALSVFGLLRQQQRVLDQLTNPSNEPLLGVSGYGQRRPLPEAMGDIEAHYAQNRRIDIRFVLSSRTSDEIQRLLREIEALQQGGQP
jgi:flagellar motor protein MotB